MEKLYNSISNKNSGKAITIGVILENSKNEILLVKNKINRINKEIYDIPSAEIKKVEEKEIINAVNSKYGINIKDIAGYVNELNLLDENCNKALQVNVYAYLNEDSELKFPDFKWESVENITNTELITESLKNSLEIYKYNKKFGRTTL